MNPELLTLILNIVFFAILGIGFLSGLKGLKKATSSLFGFIITIVVVIFLTIPVTTWVLTLNFGGKSINTYLTEAVNSMFGSMATSEVMQEVIKALPVAIASVVVCMLLIFILGIIFKIIGNIIYKAIFRKENKKYEEQVKIVDNVPQMTKKEVKPKKHRLLGGLVGTIHAFLVVVVLFMPIIGIVNIVNEIAGTNEVLAEVVTYYEQDLTPCTITLTAEGTESSFELKPAKQLLKEYLPDEFYTYAKALDNSVIAKVGKVGNLSENSLNIIARTEINGQTVKLGQEIRTLVAVYDEFVDFATTTGEALGTTDLQAIFKDIVENPNNYDFDKLYTLCDHVFDSNLIKALGSDALKLVTDSLYEANKNNEQLEPIFLRLQTAVDNYCAGGYELKDDVKAVLGAFEISAKSGLIKAVQVEPFDIENVTNILLNDATDSKPKDEVLSQLAGKITSSNLLQKVAIEATNYGSTYLQTAMNDNIKFNNDTKVVLPLIDSSKDVKINSTDLTKIVSGGFKVYEEVINEIDFDAVGKDIYTIFDYDLKNMLSIIGEEVDCIVNMDLFKQANWFASICDAMNNSEYSKYLSFNELPKGSNIKDQFALVGDSINALKSSNIISTLKNMNDENKADSLDVIIDELASLDTSNKTLSTRILQPILPCSIFKNTVVYGLDFVHDVVGDVLDSMVAGEDVVIASFNTSTISSETDRNQILNMVNKFVDYAKDIKIGDLAEDKLIDTLTDSNLEKLGIALDEVKNSNLLSTTSSGNAYNDIITALSKSDLNNVMNFKVATKDSFSWKTELKNLQYAITTINNTIKVNDGGVEKGLVKYLLNGGDFDKAYDVLNSTNARLLQPIFEISLIKPVAVDIVNTINGYIKTFVGEEIGANIVDITDIDSVNIYTQAVEITDVICAALDIDLEETDLDNIEKTKINVLLSKMKVNANHMGVFTASYNALLLKTADMINENVKSLVGTSAGNKIVKIASAYSVLDDQDKIIIVLNSALDTVKVLKGADFKDIDTDQLFLFINVLKLNETTANGVFAETYNAIMVYIVNEVNSQIANYVGTSLATQIVTYDGNTNMTTKYNYIKEIIECAVSAYKAIPTGGELKDIDSSTLTSLLEALDSIIYTRPAYNALNNKLANFVIENINSITGDTVAILTEVKDLSAQAEDIKNIVDVALEVSSSLSGKSLKVSEMDDTTKQNAISLLNPLQSNGIKTDGVFKTAYTSIVNYVATQNDTTSEFIMENFATDGVIDWNSFLTA